MSNKNLIRLIVIILTFVVPLWLLQPTYKVLTMSESEKEKLNPLEFQKLMRNSLNLGLDIQGGMYVVLGVDKDKIKGEHIRDAADRVVEVIRNRVDQLGVFEPVIQKVGEDRVVVQLPGVISKERARMILGKTALLEFKLLADENLFADFIRGADRILRGGEIFGVDTLRGPFF